MFKYHHDEIEWRGDQEAEPDPALVGQREWCHLIPFLHSGLARPVGVVPFPAPDAAPSKPGCLGYWESALYLCRYLLAWSDPGAGLHWWLKNDRPAPCRATRALRDVYAEHPHFPGFALWTWTSGDSYCDYDSIATRGRSTVTAPPRNRRPNLFLDTCLDTIVRSESGRSSPHGSDPFQDGSNPLHLGHSRATDFERAPGYLLHSDQATRKATLVFDQARGWYGSLCDHAQQLPDLGERSWHIDVVVKPIGWLGTFRRSRETGLCFTGKHSTHMAGQTLSS